jgi:hypothetical protein
MEYLFTSTQHHTITTPSPPITTHHHQSPPLTTPHHPIIQHHTATAGDNHFVTLQDVSTPSTTHKVVEVQRSIDFFLLIFTNNFKFIW